MNVLIIYGGLFYSVYVMLNKKTRKLSKFIQETREETEGMFMDYCDPIIEEDCRKLRDLDFDTADYIRTLLVCTCICNMIRISYVFAIIFGFCTKK